MRLTGSYVIPLFKVVLILWKAISCYLRPYTASEKGGGPIVAMELLPLSSVSETSFSRLESSALCRFRGRTT